MLLFVGSYAEEPEDGVELFRFDEVDGMLTKVMGYQGIKDPTFLNVHASTNSVYAISEEINEVGSDIGKIVHFKYDENGLHYINEKGSVAGSTCHIQRDPQNRYLIVTSYFDGMIGLIELHPDGTIGELLDVVQHHGSSVDIKRQDRPHPHSSCFSPNGRFLYVQDLGIDKLVCYIINEDKRILMKQGEIDIPAGYGPRHLAFHPNKSIAYLINELMSTVSVLQYDAETGTMNAIQHITTLPESYSGTNGTAEIAISDDGRFVYGSNRGHDSIVVYAVQQQGKLEIIQHISSGGGHPRHFTLTPANKHILVANRDSNNIVVFKRNELTGQLSATGHEVYSSKPVCLVPLAY